MKDVEREWAEDLPDEIFMADSVLDTLSGGWFGFRNLHFGWLESQGLMLTNADHVFKASVAFAGYRATSFSVNRKILHLVDEMNNDPLRNRYGCYPVSDMSDRSRGELFKLLFQQNAGFALVKHRGMRTTNDAGDYIVTFSSFSLPCLFLDVCSKRLPELLIQADLEGRRKNTDHDKAGSQHQDHRSDSEGGGGES